MGSTGEQEQKGSNVGALHKVWRYMAVILRVRVMLVVIQSHTAYLIWRFP